MYATVRFAMKSEIGHYRPYEKYHALFFVIGVVICVVTIQTHVLYGFVLYMVIVIT